MAAGATRLSKQGELSVIRWGVPQEPAWKSGDIVDNPSAGTALVTKTVGTGKMGQVYGIEISSDEANKFELCEGDTAKLRFALSAAGLILLILPVPLWANVAAGVVISIKTVTAAGGAGKKYQARLLYLEA
jgi:hypothetical protein